MHKTRDLPLVPGYVIKEEGVPLVKKIIDGVEHVQPFDNTGGEFLGFSYTETLTPQVATKSVRLVLDASAEGLLPNPPITGQISVYEVPTGTRVTNGNVTVTNNTVAVTGQANATVDIVYAYHPIVQDLMFEHRMLIPFISSTEMTGTIGVIIDGEVWTDKVDLAADFTADNSAIYVSDAGLVSAFVPSVSGSAVTNLPANSLLLATVTITSASTGSVANGFVTMIGYPILNNPFVGLRITR
jgi:hypothetical protein